MGLGWTLQSSDCHEWAHGEAVPEARRLANLGEFEAAFTLALDAARYIEGDPVMEEIWSDISEIVDITSDPSGANVYVRPYAATEKDWVLIGRTPIEDHRIVTRPKRWRIELVGYEPLLLAPHSYRSINVRLDQAGTWPDGMVGVPAGQSVGWLAETGNSVRGRFRDTSTTGMR
jgi:hypothetical protein